MKKFQSPMLARDFEGNEQLIKFPAYVQPKVDGVRCVTNGQTFWSRNGKVFPRMNMKHLQMEPLPYLLDGEISMPEGRSDFEEIVSVLKRANHPDSFRLCFHAFDVIADEPYARRCVILREIFQRHLLRYRSTRWKRLLTKKVNDMDGIENFYKSCLAMGYEGVMVRSAFGAYASGKRTADLLKWKPLKDAEFEIVDIVEAKGKDAGTPIFICETRHESRFRVRPKGTTAQRRKMWRDREKLIGKMLTVEYQNLTRYGIPRFPRAKVLRDYE